MIRFLTWCIAGILLAGIVHIVVILSAPRYGTQDALHRFAGTSGTGTFQLIPHASVADGTLPGADVYFAHALCRFSLEENAVRIRAELNAPFWSLAVFDLQGTNRYSVNDRVAESGKLDIRLLTPLQRVQLRENDETGTDAATGVDVPLTFTNGFILIRVFAEDGYARRKTLEDLQSATCGRDENRPAPDLLSQNIESGGN